MVHLDYRDARPIYLQIVDGFRAQILAGVLQSGEKLPSVRELATGLSINPNTIQRAYRQLEALGALSAACRSMRWRNRKNCCMHLMERRLRCCSGDSRGRSWQTGF